jgi:hypothetical protein
MGYRTQIGKRNFGPPGALYDPKLVMHHLRHKLEGPIKGIIEIDFLGLLWPFLALQIFS